MQTVGPKWEYNAKCPGAELFMQCPCVLRNIWSLHMVWPSHRRVASVWNVFEASATSVHCSFDCIVPNPKAVSMKKCQGAELFMRYPRSSATSRIWRSNNSDAISSHNWADSFETCATLAHCYLPVRKLKILSVPCKKCQGAELFLHKVRAPLHEDRLDTISWRGLHVTKAIPQRVWS